MRFMWGVACTALMMLSGAQAMAREFDFKTDFGPVHLYVSDYGDVHGNFPDYDGRIVGRVEGGDRVNGIWTQPRSDHPCREEREGSYHWGYLVFYLPDHGRHMEGRWGYCGEQPNREWNGRLIEPEHEHYREREYRDR